MFSTKKAIATAILGSAIALPTSGILSSAAYAEENEAEDIVSQEVQDGNKDIADVDIQDAVVDPYALDASDCDAVLGVKPGQTQVFDLTKIFNTAQTAKFQLEDQIANLPQINGWDLNVDGNKLTVVANGDRAPLPVSFGVNVTDEQGQVINGVLSAFTDAKTNTYTNVQQGIDAMREAVQNGLSVTQAQRQDQNQGGNGEVNTSENTTPGNDEQDQIQIQNGAVSDQSGETSSSGYRIIGQGVIRGGQNADTCEKEVKNPCDVESQEDAEAAAQYGPKVDTGGSVNTGIVANFIKSLFA